MIEILATPDKSYAELFPGDWLVIGLLITVVWVIKYGLDYSDNS